MTFSENALALLREAAEWRGRGYPDEVEWRLRAAWKYTQASAGVPACDWGDTPPEWLADMACANIDQRAVMAAVACHMGVRHASA